MPKYVEVDGVVWQLEEREYQYFDTRTKAGKNAEVEYLAKELTTPPNLVPIKWEDVDDYYYLASMMTSHGVLTGGRQQLQNSVPMLKKVIERAYGDIPQSLADAVWSKSYEAHHSSGYTDVLQDYRESLDTMKDVISELYKLVNIRKIVDSIPLTALNSTDVIHFKDLLTKHL